MNVIIVLLTIFFSMLPPCVADNQNREDMVALFPEFKYPIGKGDSKEKSRALALFGAKLKAVAFSAKYLTHKGLLEHYGKKQNEIFCLTTREIHTEIIDEGIQETDKVYYVRIKAEINNSDFIKAEIKNLELEKNELKLTYAEEMGQYVIEGTDPGLELSRAYRHIRKAQWRLAIIYLDHLGKKYPNWSDLYLAKALAFYGQDEIEKMKDALKTACSLDNQEACNDFQNLNKNQEKNFTFKSSG
jgi:hypothetical protein